ncbi:Uncharacterised protein [Chlamydia abortus]|uniref:Uncharacterized protein n=1 Tax=Paenibacillus residui TaxID=629724 RepID=A0ABW3D3L8_9BACL|nr:hypothetical protein [Paenibacillus sp. 32O-W]SHE12327.1 Uncharacterised protein [Chlamydia abortus]
MKMLTRKMMWLGMALVRVDRIRGSDDGIGGSANTMNDITALGKRLATTNLPSGLSPLY